MREKSDMVSGAFIQVWKVQTFKGSVFVRQCCAGEHGANPLNSAPLPIA
jgi:hypothetical protein